MCERGENKVQALSHLHNARIGTSLRSFSLLTPCSSVFVLDVKLEICPEVILWLVC